MAEERVFIKLSPENVITIGLLSAVSYFGFVLARQVIRGVAKGTGDHKAVPNEPARNLQPHMQEEFA